MQQGPAPAKWMEMAVSEAWDRHADIEQTRKNLIQARDCFVWKGMEEDGVV
jgi:hypothetical protein